MRLPALYFFIAFSVFAQTGNVRAYNDLTILDSAEVYSAWEVSFQFK